MSYKKIAFALFALAFLSGIGFSAFTFYVVAFTKQADKALMADCQARLFTRAPLAAPPAKVITIQEIKRGKDTATPFTFHFCSKETGAGGQPKILYGACRVNSAGSIVGEQVTLLAPGDCPIK